jgi:peptidoglycan/xylan/chitin deacetylase (PgdA/CDA1 family)
VVDMPGGRAGAQAWGQAGHWVANHSYHHRDLNQEPAAEFQADIMRGHAAVAELPGFVRFFRFPFLHEGDTAAKRDGVRAFLRAAGYQVGGVSIDASDWYYEARYRRWRKAHPGQDPAPFRQAYLDHLWDRARYYDELARRVTGRAVKHILLLHTNSLNADFLPDVIAMFRGRGWGIIDPAEAFADPIYRQQTAGLPAGQSVIWSLARAQGIPGLRFPGESEQYEKPKLDAAGL